MHMPLSTESECVDALHATAPLGGSSEAFLDAICRTGRTMFDVPTCLIYLNGQHEPCGEGEYGSISGTGSLRTPLCGHAILSDEIMVVEDATRDARFSADPQVLAELGIRFYAGVPLFPRPGVCVGVLCLFDTATRTLSERQRGQLRDLARIAAAHLDLTNATAVGEAGSGERMHASRALPESEATYRLLVEGVRDYGIYMLDPAGTVMNWNDGAQRIKGYAAEEIVGAHFSCFFTEEERERGAPQGALETARRLGVFKDEGWRVRKDGKRFWASVVLHPIRDEAGGLLGFTKITRDATRKRAAEEALQASETRYRLLAENTSDVIIQSDLDTTRRYVSPAAMNVLGFTPEEMIALRPMDCVHPDDADAYEAVLDNLTSERVERTASQQRYRRKDGSWIWTEISFTLIRHAVEGHATGYVAALRDIDARKRAELAAAESEARYREVVETAHNAILAQLAEGVIVTDAMGRITLVNEAAAAIHGVARLDVEPDDYSASYHLHTESGEPYAAHDLPLARAVRGETVRDVRWRVRRPDGVEVLAIGSARPLIGRDGHPIGAVLTMRDDTARDAAERSLRASEAALRELNATLSDRVAAQTRDAEAARLEAERASAAKTEFLATMSHEIRTPLNAIIGFTDLMVSSGRLQPDLHRQAELVRTSGGALLTVVNDILDFSKVEAGAIELDRQDFGPYALIDSCLNIVRGSAERKGLAIRAEIDPMVPRSVFGDEARLRQVLLNLLNNAVKFTHRGSVTLAVKHLGTDPSGERLRFGIVDTGIGIAKGKQDRLFRRFSQVDGSIARDFGGTGLGLAICKQLIDLMDGEVGVISDEGAGATFWFSLALPLGAVGRPPTLVRTAPEPHRTGRILVAEDNAINQELARAVLEAAGFVVEVVPDGRAAVRAVERMPFDLVLMDVQMSGMDGLTATRLIRALGPPAATMPIIAMTGNVLSEQVRMYRKAGMDDHVGKPFNTAALFQVLDRWLSRGTDAKASRRTEATNDPGFLDRTAFDEVMDLIGTARAVGILDALSEELNTLFRSDGVTLTERDLIRFQAHSCVSSAGTLGFLVLSSACHALECCNEQRIAQEGLGAFQRLLKEAQELARRVARHAMELAATWEASAPLVRRSA